MILHYLVLMAVEPWLVYMHCLLMQYITMYARNLCISTCHHYNNYNNYNYNNSDGHNDTDRGCSGVALLAGTSIQFCMYGCDISQGGRAHQNGRVG